MCQLEKPRANEITEPLAFTVCKLELHGKGIVSQSRSRRTRFSRGQLWAKRRSKCRSARSRRHSLRKWNLTIQPWRLILASFWKWLPRNIIVFFSFLHCQYFFPLTPGTSRDEALSASLSEGWLNHEPLSLSARFCLLSGWNSLVFFFGPGFVLLFIQELFSVLERFMLTKLFC